MARVSVNTTRVAAKSNSSPDSESVGIAIESAGSVYSSEGSVGWMFEYRGTRSSVYGESGDEKGIECARTAETDLVFRLLECPVDVVLGLPHPWHTHLVVPEPFLKVATQLAQDHRLRSLLVNFGA